MKMPSAVLIVFSAASVGASAEPNWLDEVSLSGDAAAASVFQRRGDSIRIQSHLSPFSAVARLLGTPRPNLRIIESTFALGGDFEFNAQYEVHQLGNTDTPPRQEANAEISLGGRGTYGAYAINVGYRVEKGVCFNVLYSHPHSGGYHFNVLTFPRTSKTGRIAMQKQGAQIVFFAADGPDAPLGELVRLPCRPELCPNLRFSAYHGNGGNPEPVDVTYSKMMLRADRFVRGTDARAVLPEAGPPQPYGVHIDYSQRPERLLADFKGGNNTADAFRVEEKEIRINPPVLPAYRKDASTYYFRESCFALEGDFEISWRFRVNTIGPFGREGAGSAAFAVTLQNDTQIGTTSFSRGASRDVAARYAITSEIPNRNGLHYDSQHIRTAAQSGRMILQRIGCELTFTVEEDNGPPRMITRVPFISGRIPKLRLVAYQGSNCTNVLDAAISDFSVKAERIIDNETNEPLGANPTTSETGNHSGGEPILLDAMPQKVSKKWWYLKLGLLGLGILLLVSGVVIVLRSRMRITK
jgi:hypothetical protein